MPSYRTAYLNHSVYLFKHTHPAIANSIYSHQSIYIQLLSWAFTKLSLLNRHVYMLSLTFTTAKVKPYYSTKVLNMQTSVAHRSIITGLSLLIVGMVYGTFIASEILGHPVLTLATCVFSLEVVVDIDIIRRTQPYPVLAKRHADHHCRIGAQYILILPHEFNCASHIRYVNIRSMAASYFWDCWQFLWHCFPQSKCANLINIAPLTNNFADVY